MTLAAGTKLGPYQIVEPLGAGGMGEVYRARDTKLGRDVALKVLPSAFAADPERMARFKREAQVLASLNHAHIGAIYGFEDSGSVHALVMELIEGPTLADRIARGPIPLDEALPVAREIAEALEAAHERGIVHRDLKPANIKITPDGNVKVLDFGLAKAVEGDASSTDIHNSPTLTRMSTQAGIILGTAAYMSPEQAKGKSVDRRTDIWAFGCVLFEMLTGKHAFEGETVSDTLAAVIRGEPDGSLLPADTPARIRELLSRCLNKDVRQRLQSAGEARIAIDQVLSSAPEQTKPAAVAAGRSWLREAIAWLLVAALTLIAVGLGVWNHLHQASEESSPMLAYIPPPPDTSFNAFGFGAGPVVVSSDGKQLAFTATDQNGISKLWLRPLSSDKAMPVAGTEDAAAPFWSADGRALGFFEGDKLKSVDLNNGNIQVLAESSCSGSGGAWSTAGNILFTPGCDAPLSEIASSGGTPHPVAKLEESELQQGQPTFLPDGRRFLYISLDKNRTTAIWAGSLDSSEKKLVLKDATSPRFSSGYLLFIRGGNRVFAQRFDPESFKLTGNALALAESYRYSVSSNGILAYQGGSNEGRIEWFDHNGNTVGPVSPTAIYHTLRISPDGTRVLLTITDAQSGVLDLWSVASSGGVQTRLTFGPARKEGSAWSPDGKYVAYSCLQNDKVAVCRKPADGSGAQEVLYTFGPEINAANVVDWSPDGRYISFDQHKAKVSRWENWVLPLFGDRKIFQPAPVTFDQYDGCFSPDGRWLAYFSYESGRPEAYVVPFPGPGGKFQISTSGGWLVHWDKSNRLYFLTRGNRLMQADLSLSEKSVQVKAIQPLFQVNVPSFNAPLMDATSDGSRFVVISAADPTATRSITLLLNWEAELKTK
jgi:serine/threonine protein kinase